MMKQVRLLHLQLWLMLLLNHHYDAGSSSVVLVDAVSSDASTTITTTGDPSMMEFFRVTLGLKQFMSTSTKGQNDHPQPLHVISAGLPRTGTASFVIAMKKLGLHSYHMKDGAVETPGHLDLWYNLYRNLEINRNNKNLKDVDDADDADTSGGSAIITSTSLFDKILDDMSTKGFNVTSDAPACFWYKEQIKRYQSAKVILTVRGNSNGSKAWAKSFKIAIIDVMILMKEIPFRWMPMIQKLEYFVQQMLLALEIDIDPNTGYPVIDQLPIAYDTWIKQVKATVPSENLLIFAPQDGWEPLCTFLTSPSSSTSNSDESLPSLSFPSSVVRTRCDEILKSGEPYPYVNDKSKVISLIWGLYLLSTLVKISPIVLFVGLSFVVVGLKRKNNRRQRNQDDVKSKSE